MLSRSLDSANRDHCSWPSFLQQLAHLPCCQFVILCHLVNEGVLFSRELCEASCSREIHCDSHVAMLGEWLEQRVSPSSFCLSWILFTVNPLLLSSTASIVAVFTNLGMVQQHAHPSSYTPSAWVNFILMRYYSHARVAFSTVNTVYELA